LPLADYEDRDKARDEIIDAAEDIIDKAAIPPAAEQKQARNRPNSC
jgi:hypothetical protein